MVKVPWERCALDQLVPLGLLGHLGQLDQPEKLELLDHQDLKVKLSVVSFLVLETGQSPNDVIHVKD